MEFIDPSALVIQGINLTIVLVLLRKFIFVPYLAYIDEEATKRKELEQSILNASTIITQAEDEAKGVINTAKSEAKSIRENAKTLAKQESQEILAAASKDADAILIKAQSDIANERIALEGELGGKILRVALSLNEKLFGKNEANAAFVRETAKDFVQ